MISSKSAVHVLFGLTVALQIGCSTETDVPASSTADNTASPGPAIPVQTFQSTSNPQYTGKVLNNGSVLLDWPMDPEATGYEIYRDDILVAEVPLSDLSFLDSGQVLDDATQLDAARNNQRRERRVSYKIYSVKPGRQKRIWADQLEVTISTENLVPTTSSEESPILQAANPDTQPNIPTVSIDTSEPVQINPVQVVPEPVDPAPVDPAPVDPEPVDPEPVDPEPVDPEPVDPEPVDPEPVDPDPVDPDPVDPDPVDPDPVDPDPVDPDPVDPDPVDPDPVDPEPVDPEPVDPEPVDPEPVDPEPVDPEPVDPEPVDPEPVDPEPVDPEPVDPEPVDPEPVDPEPVDPEPVDPEPVDPDPVDPDPVDPDPVDPDPVDPDPVDPDPVDPDPVDPDPVDPEPNSIPRIDSISLGCDLVLESIGIDVGVATNFTLFVDDESPLTLSYSAISDDTSVADVSVDSSGVFTVIGNDTGNTTLSIVVTDDQGQQDQLLLNVISEI